MGGGGLARVEGGRHGLGFLVRGRAGGALVPRPRPPRFASLSQRRGRRLGSHARAHRATAGVLGTHVWGAGARHEGQNLSAKRAEGGECGGRGGGRENGKRREAPRAAAPAANIGGWLNSSSSSPPRREWGSGALSFGVCCAEAQRGGWYKKRMDRGLSFLRPRTRGARTRQGSRTLTARRTVAGGHGPYGS